jgi:hypothetical protein
MMPIFLSLGGVQGFSSLCCNQLGDMVLRLRVRREQIREILGRAFVRVESASADLLLQYVQQLLMADLRPQRLESGVVLQELLDMLLFPAFALDFFKDWPEADVCSASIIQ